MSDPRPIAPLRVTDIEATLRTIFGFIPGESRWFVICGVTSPHANPPRERQPDGFMRLPGKCAVVRIDTVGIVIPGRENLEGVGVIGIIDAVPGGENLDNLLGAETTVPWHNTFGTEEEALARAEEVLDVFLRTTAERIVASMTPPPEGVVVVPSADDPLDASLPPDGTLLN